METYYNVSIEAAGPLPTAEQQLEDLADILSDLGAQGASVGAGGLAGGASVVLSIETPDYSTEALDMATRDATSLFVTALEKAGIPVNAIARVDVMAAPYFEQWLEQSSGELAGVTELARLLGVSKQRVSELRERRDFPAPAAVLAAGPVWRVSNLKRFLAEWPRKPGRPQMWRRALEQVDKDPDALRELTERERQVLYLLWDGASTRDVAEQIGVSNSTVRSSIQRILEKLNVQSRLEAVTRAMKAAGEEHDQNEETTAGNRGAETA